MHWRHGTDPPWWWKPWLRPWFTVQDWWQRARPVKVIEVSPRRGRKLFDRACRKRLGISGAEFLERYDAGYYDDGPGYFDPDGHMGSQVAHLVMLIPFAR